VGVRVADGSGVEVAVREGVRVKGSTVRVAAWVVGVSGGPHAAPTRLRKNRTRIYFLIRKLPGRQSFFIKPPII
jgi:hypothetical protein